MRPKQFLPASEVPKVFSNMRVREIVARLKPPLDEDQVRRFAASLRKSAKRYIRDKQAEKVNVAAEIKAIYRAADLKQYHNARQLMRHLSKQTSDFLKERAARIGLKLPKPSFFLNRARRGSACEAV